jgi:hypothetical protein
MSTTTTATENTRPSQELTSRSNLSETEKDLAINDMIHAIKRLSIILKNQSDITKLNQRIIEVVTQNYPTTLLTENLPNSSEEALLLFAHPLATVSILHEITHTEEAREYLRSAIEEGKKRGKITRHTELFHNLGSLIPKDSLVTTLERCFNSLTTPQQQAIGQMVLPKLSKEQTTQLLYKRAIRPDTHAKIVLCAILSGIIMSQVASSNLPTKFRLALGTCPLLASIAPLAALQTTEKNFDAIQKKTKETSGVVGRHILNHRTTYAAVAIGAILTFGIWYLRPRYKSLLNQATFHSTKSPSIPVSNEPPGPPKSTSFPDVSTSPTTGNPSIGTAGETGRLFTANPPPHLNNIPETEDSPFYRLYTKLRQVLLEDENLRTLVKEKARQVGAVYRDFFWQLFIQTNRETLFEGLSPL